MHHNENNEISAFDLLILIIKNSKIILFFVFICVLISLFTTSMGVLINPEYSVYSVDTIVAIEKPTINDRTRLNISYIFSHPTVLSRAQRRIRLESNDYSLTSRISDDERTIIYTLQGPDLEQLYALSNQVMRISKPILEDSMNELIIEVVEVSDPQISKFGVVSTIDWMFRGMAGMVVGLMMSIFYIVLVYLYRSFNNTQMKNTFKINSSNQKIIDAIIKSRLMKGLEVKD